MVELLATVGLFVIGVLWLACHFPYPARWLAVQLLARADARETFLKVLAAQKIVYAQVYLLKNSNNSAATVEESE